MVACEEAIIFKGLYHTAKLEGIDAWSQEGTVYAAAAAAAGEVA